MKSRKPKPANSPKRKTGKPGAGKSQSDAGPAASTKSSAAAVEVLQPEKVPPIVGIGASAGGLNAFTQLLRALPPDTGMAFVLVQHLEARHESMLTKLLAGVTRMPIGEVEHGTRVRPNHVYVIPPNADLTIRSGVLQLARR